MAESDFIYIFQKGFNFSQDGPGNRLVYHLCGCNLFCPWCSNPEGMKKSADAKKVGISDILDEVRSCRMMFFDGGGVTFTGGECTLQKDVLLKLIKLLKEEGIHTCIETNASLNGVDELYGEVDYMIADFKSADEQTLKNVTGADRDTVLKNILNRAKTKKPLLVRIPLIKNFNNGEKNAELFAECFKKIQNESENNNLFFEILTYHEFGKEKWEKIGLEYKFENGFVNKEDVLILKNAITSNNLKLITT